MMRIPMALAAMLACGSALAQPAPRITLDVALPAADGFELGPYGGAPGRLALGPDGTHYVLLHELRPGPDWQARMRDSRATLVALAPDGTRQRRVTVPIGARTGSGAMDIQSLVVTVARTGDLSIFVSGPPADETTPGPRPPRAILLRLGADLQVKKATPIGAPDAVRQRDDPGSFYGVVVTRPTTDNAVMLGGGFGIGPQAWWMGKFSLDGVRLWQAGPGPGFPEFVGAMTARPDGTWLSLVAEMRQRDRNVEWIMQRHAASGKPMARHRLKQPVNGAGAFLANGAVLVVNAAEEGTAGALFFLDDEGRVLREVSWPFPQTSAVVATADGFAAIVSTRVHGSAPTYIVRADAAGTIRWRSPKLEPDEIVAEPDGQIAAVVRPDKEGAALHLMRFADP